MTEFTPARLAELKAVAEAASQSSWHIENDSEEDYEAGIAYAEWPSVLVGPENAIPSQWARDHGETDRVQEIPELKPEDADHIAAFDPPTVLSLIDALEAANESKPSNSVTSGSANERELAELRAALSAKTAEVEGVRDELAAWMRSCQKARLRRNEARAAIERVRELHRKGTVYSHEDSCTNSAEEHSEEHHRESANSYGEYYCEQMPEYDICIDCSEHADPDQEWPCPTILALETGDDDE